MKQCGGGIKTGSACTEDPAYACPQENSYRHKAYTNKRKAIRAAEKVIITSLKMLRLMKGPHTHSFSTATNAPNAAENVPARSTDRDRKHIISLDGGSCSVAG